MSRVSGTNVSYLSNFSAIKLDIIRFKNKPSNGEQAKINEKNNLDSFRKKALTPAKFQLTGTNTKTTKISLV